MPMMPMMRANGPQRVVYETMLRNAWLLSGMLAIPVVVTVAVVPYGVAYGPAVALLCLGIVVLLVRRRFEFTRASRSMRAFWCLSLTPSTRVLPLHTGVAGVVDDYIDVAVLERSVPTKGGSIRVHIVALTPRPPTHMAHVFPPQALEIFSDTDESGARKLADAIAADLGLPRHGASDSAAQARGAAGV